MGKDSKIEWTHHTFNPWWGCEKVAPECAHCYAETLSKRTGNGVWGKESPRRFFKTKHWAEPLKWEAEAVEAQERQRVFCGSMCDVFEARADLETPRSVLFGLIQSTPHLDWLLLTKRPENIRAMIPPKWLKEPRFNVWFGTTAGTQKTFNENVAALVNVPAAVRFVSMEPLLEAVNLATCLEIDLSGPLEDPPKTNLHWIIVGGESGGKARPMCPEWARTLRDQCNAADVPFFFKQWGEWAPYCDKDAIETTRRELVQVGDGTARAMWRVGKDRSGRKLDGVEHNAFPEVLK